MTGYQIQKLFFGTYIPKKFSLSYTWDKDKNCYIQRDGKFLTYTRKPEQEATIGTVKSSLKIPLQHNGVVPIKITGPVIKEEMAYFITDDNSARVGTPPSISLMAFTRLKVKHLSTSWCQIIQINTSLLTKKNT